LGGGGRRLVRRRLDLLDDLGLERGTTISTIFARARDQGVGSTMCRATGTTKPVSAGSTIACRLCPG